MVSGPLPPSLYSSLLWYVPRPNPSACEHVAAHGITAGVIKLSTLAWRDVEGWGRKDLGPQERQAALGNGGADPLILVSQLVVFCMF